MEQILGAFAQMLLEEALKVLVPVLAALLIAWLTGAVEWIRLKLGEPRWQAVTAAIHYAIYAAEQTGLSGKLAEMGLSKKEFAIETAQEFLADQGIYLDVRRISKLIESELGQTINAGRIWDEATKKKSAES